MFVIVNVSSAVVPVVAVALANAWSSCGVAVGDDEVVEPVVAARAGDGSRCARLRLSVVEVAQHGGVGPDRPAAHAVAEVAALACTRSAARASSATSSRRVGRRSSDRRTTARGAPAAQSSAADVDPGDEVAAGRRVERHPLREAQLDVAAPGSGVRCARRPRGCRSATRAPANVPSLRGEGLDASRRRGAGSSGCRRRTRRCRPLQLVRAADPAVVARNSRRRWSASPW